MYRPWWFWLATSLLYLFNWYWILTLTFSCQYIGKTKHATLSLFGHALSSYMTAFSFHQLQSMHHDKPCSFEHLSIVCAERDLHNHVGKLRYVLREVLYECEGCTYKYLQKKSLDQDAKDWIQETFSTHSKEEQVDVLDIIKLQDKYSSCKQNGSNVTCWWTLFSLAHGLPCLFWTLLN